MTVWQKIIVAGVLFAGWGTLVAYGLTPVDTFVAAIRDALIALGVFHATMTTPKGKE